MLIRLLLLAVLFATPVMTEEPTVRRLESVTWNPVTTKLTWAVSHGNSDANGKYVADRDQLVYEIDLSEVTMEHKGAKRRFSKEEAANVLMVMKLISRYAQESTVWWEAGKGEPVEKREKVMLKPRSREAEGARLLAGPRQP